MSRLFNLKEWLTVEEAANRLSTVFKEDVSDADVLRLALDGHIKLSVNFVNHATAKLGKVVSWVDTEWKLLPRLSFRTGAAAPELIFLPTNIETAHHSFGSF